MAIGRRLSTFSKTDNLPPNLGDYYKLPRHDLIAIFGEEWQDGGSPSDEITPNERIELFQLIKPLLESTESVQKQVIQDMKERMALGVRKYDTLLYPFNGRDFLQDLYEELLDACCYVKGAMIERDTGMNFTSVEPEDRH